MRSRRSRCSFVVAGGGAGEGRRLENDEVTAAETGADLLGGVTVSLHAGLRMLLELIDQNAKAPLPSDRVIGLSLGLRLEVE